MKLLSLDLEMNQPSGKIIQIGAAVGDTETGTVSNTLSIFVNPHEQLSDFIINLTGIKQKNVDNAQDLEAGYRLLKSFAEVNKTFVNLLTWGGDDVNYLRNQLNVTEGWPFGRRWIDAKTIYISYRISNGENIGGGLKKSIRALNLEFEGNAHDGMDDAINTFRIYYELLQKFK